MEKIDTEKIKYMTNLLVGYDNYERMEKMRKNKLKNFTFTVLACFIVVGGTISVDALTDNSISNAIKDMFKITLNGQDYNNAKCEDLGNGNVKCVMDGKDLGEDGEVSFELNKDYKGDISVEVNNSPDEMSINTNFSIENKQ